MKDNRIKVSILRILAFSMLLCVLTVATFSFSEILFERLSRGVNQTSDNTKVTRWILENGKNILLFPILAIFGAVCYRKNDDDAINAIYHKEKKIQLIVLFVFLYFVFLPYYVHHNMAANVSVIEVLGDKVVWFTVQIIPISALIMYHSDRADKLFEKSEENKDDEGEENEQ